MSILAALVRVYDRLPNVPPFGYSAEKIGFLVSLEPNGDVSSVTDLRLVERKKKFAPTIFVPQAVKRASGIAPNFLWDKTAYVLGVTAGTGKRTADEHAAFVERHLVALDGTDDAGLIAFMRFLSGWTPDRFVSEEWPEEMRDENIAFSFEPDRLHRLYLHDRDAAKLIWSRLTAEAAGRTGMCLVTGERGPIARLHPSIRGVWGAQSSGASLVSFNSNVYESHGHKQGENAPVSERAAAAYGAVLNEFLKAGSSRRIQIGDASTVFWADGSKAEVAETIASIMLGAEAAAEAGAVNEKSEAAKVGSILEGIKAGKSVANIDPELAKGVTFCVLGLSPNAARLSVRYWMENDFGTVMDNFQAYMRDIAFEPWPPSRGLTTIKSAVLRTAPARRDEKGRVKYDSGQISPLFSGELLRAVLTGSRFPGALLPLLLMRVRADHVLDPIRMALMKALVVRAMRLEGRLPKRTDGTTMEDYLVRSDPDDPNDARRLGRLFALIERAQAASLGSEVNATVKDKFLSAAAATPRQVFIGLLKNANQHVKRLRNGHSDAGWIKDAVHARRVAASLDRDIGMLWATFEEGVPAQHSSEEQAMFFVGYYQERYGRKTDPQAGEAPDEISDTMPGEEETRP